MNGLVEKRKDAHSRAKFFLVALEMPRSQVNFLWQMENYFKVARVDEEAKVDTTTMYSVDDPMHWWRR